MSAIHTVRLSPDWKIINALSQVDKFGGSWISIEQREGQSLKQLKSVATVRSVGASTRIEGSKMTDAEVEVLLKNLKVAKLEERDAQEVVGYFEALDLIGESFADIDISENNIKMLHNVMLKHSEKDQWHKGNYKQLSNAVEARNTDGSKYVVFKTAEPGFSTEEAMKLLVRWYGSDTTTHPVARTAIFVYDFLSIHPFQDGNGRLSRLLATLLLLKHGYTWVQYVSFENEIENRKSDYYKVLMQCQRQRPNEDVYPWAIFFLECLHHIQDALMHKLHIQGNTARMSLREKKIYTLIKNQPGCKSSEVAQRLNIPLPTVKRILMEMTDRKFLIRQGMGKATSYTVEDVSSIEKDSAFVLTNSSRKKEFILASPNCFLEIKKIIAKPTFNWTDPNDWSTRLVKHGLTFSVKGVTSANGSSEQRYSITALIAPNSFSPIFTLAKAINVPNTLWENLNHSAYPITLIVEIFSDTMDFDFDIMFVYDALM